MKRFQLQQKLIALGDDFTVRDEAGNDVYFVDGRALAIGDKLSFQDPSGNELAFISQRVLSWGRTYEITRNGAVAAVVKKELFTLFHCKFSVDVPGPDDLEAEGDFTDHEYVFKRGDRVVATVSKEWLNFRDTYGVEIADGEDEILILASAVVVDLSCHPDDKR
ncbi:MAG: LURP-one-related family protein [Gemmatimonadota bacterium]|nr:LURP-one-related family protein [Gemmatimonadota bacterium]